MVFDNGTNEGWPTQMLPLLNGTDPHLRLTISQQGWVVDMMFILQIFGAVIPFLVLKKLGLRFLMIMAALTKALAWWIIAFAREYWALLLGRSLAGIGFSLNYFTVPMYMGETADKTVRGPIGGLFSTSLTIGLIAVYVAGVWLDRLSMSLLMSLIPVVFLLCCYWIPNSPVYLVKKNRLPEAKSVLKRLGEENVENRISEIKRALDEEEGNTSSKLLESLKKPESIKAFYLISIMQFCDNGYLPILAYKAYVFEESGVNVNLFVIISGVIPFVVVCICMAVVKYTGKRKLVVTSILCLFIGEIFLAGYYALRHLNVDVSAFKWISAVFVVIYTIGSYSNYNMVACYAGEIFPFNVKPASTLYCTCIFSLVNSVMIKVHEVHISNNNLNFGY